MRLSLGASMPLALGAFAIAASEPTPPPRAAQWSTRISGAQAQVALLGGLGGRSLLRGGLLRSCLLLRGRLRLGFRLNGRLLRCCRFPITRLRGRRCLGRPHEAGSAGVEGQGSASQDCRHGVSAPAHRPEDAESRSSYWEGVHDSKEADGVS